MTSFVSIFSFPCLSCVLLTAGLHWDPVASTERRLIGLVLKSSDLGHDSLVQSACSTCWFDCHFQFSHDPVVLEWGISGRKYGWKLMLLVWQLHSSESNAKCSSYLYSDLMLTQGIYCMYMLGAETKARVVDSCSIIHQNAQYYKWFNEKDEQLWKSICSKEFN